MQPLSMNFTTFRQLTRLEQTLFGLPFVLAGALLPFLTQEIAFAFELRWLWILPAFFSARIAGMSLNQAIDAHIDAANPRTRQRVIPAGKMQKGKALKLGFFFLVLFFVCCSQINRITLLFSIMAIILLWLYSYTKRFTWTCHFILGLIHFLGPLMASIALCGVISLSSLLLSTVSMLLLIGVDMIYALQDWQFDKNNAVCSFPVRWGSKNTFVTAKVIHFFSILSLLSLGVVSHFSIFSYLFVITSVLFITFFHWKALMLWQGSSFQRGIEPLFFYTTVGVSCSTLMFILLGAL